MNAITRLLAGAALAAASLAAAAQGDAEAGRLKVYTCSGCHGIPGYKNVYPHYNVPRIGGQNYDYLVAALTAYRKGERPHPTMQAQAEGYSEQDLKDIATYLAGLAGESAR
ncbi:MAG TPA: c-type cytochrome [Xanthomonadaceae bacterium]|nr:c-type cytochrome [Xanthomonadaceae bacterium]